MCLGVPRGSTHVEVPMWTYHVKVHVEVPRGSTCGSIMRKYHVDVHVEVPCGRSMWKYPVEVLVYNLADSSLIKLKTSRSSMQPMRTITDDQVAESYLANNDITGDPHNDNINNTASLEPTISQDNDSFSIHQTWHLSSLHLHPTNSTYHPGHSQSAFDFSPISLESGNTFPDPSIYSTHPTQENNRITERSETLSSSSQHTPGNVEGVEDKKLDTNCDENNNLSASVTPSSDVINQRAHDQTSDKCFVLVHRPGCLTKQKSVDTCRLFLECKSPKTVLSPHKNCLIKFSWQPHCTDVVLPCILGRISPPIWTSFALRENITARSEIIRPTPQMPVFRNGFAVNLDNIFQPIRESSSGDDLRGGGSSGWWSSSSEGVRSPSCGDSRRTSQDSSSNNSNDGGVWDDCGECRTAAGIDDTDDDDDSDAAGGGGLCLACRREYSPALGDLESFLASLPALRDRVESPLTDDFIVMRERMDPIALEASRSVRPGNPVAGALKHGGIEHFLPIDYEVHDGAGQL
ncbi:hypothetical protein Btru_009055 [Bulinus truncatus]|nr:hypothetical protein Btru_009055 [Bulinus truncatus]